MEFAAAFPYRHSGTANNKAAAEWPARFFAGLGCKVETDNYKRFLYGKLVELHNVQAVLPGQTSETVVVVAHTDQARTTVQGTDNDASGIGIMMHLAEIFAGRDNYRTLVFLAGDGEEYGMLGARRFLSVYPPERIVASVSWWYFLQMLAFRMIPFYAALAGIIAISSGLTLVSGAPARTARTTRGLQVRPTGRQRHNA
ncbi:MAG: M28 family peptidase [Bacillota bacterium]